MNIPIFPIFLSLILVLSSCTHVFAPTPMVLSSHHLQFVKSVKTWKEFREQNVVMQKFDYSCGSGALATLMRYYFQDEVTEREILQEIIHHLNDAEIESRQKNGFSMFDLQQFAKRRGYQAVGVKLKMSALPKLRGPVLVYIHVKKDKHFAILRGVKDDRVFLADPSRGNLRKSISAFSKEWTGITLVLGKEGFGTPTEHPLAIRDEELMRNELNVVRYSRGLFVGLY